MCLNLVDLYIVMTYISSLGYPYCCFVLGKVKQEVK